MDYVEEDQTVKNYLQHLRLNNILLVMDIEELFNGAPIINDVSRMDKLARMDAYAEHLTSQEALEIGLTMKNYGYLDRMKTCSQGLIFRFDDLPDEVIDTIYNKIVFFEEKSIISADEPDDDND